MSKFKLSFQIAIALVLIAVTGISYAQTTTAKGRAVVKATVVSGGPPLITTVAGGATNDGALATSAALFGTRNLALDGAGNMFLADYNSNRIRRVDAKTGIITTAVGTGESRESGLEGPASKMSIIRPNDVAADAAGNIYFQYGNRILKADPSGTVTVATTINSTYMCTDSAGNLYLTGSRIQKVDAKTGTVTTVVGPSLSAPSGTFIDAAGNLYFSNTGNHRVSKIAPSGLASTIAGSGKQGFSGDGGQAIDASLSRPAGVFVDGNGNVYIADQGNNRVRKIDSTTGIITTVAGTGDPAFAGDGGSAKNAALNQPRDIFVDDSGNMFIADQMNNRVRKVDASSGIITTVAGNGIKGGAGPGTLATQAPMWEPQDILIDKAGTIYIAEGNFIRKIDPKSGIMLDNVAGNGFDFSGDGGPASQASLKTPGSICWDSAGNLYILDANNFRVRRVDARTGIITTVIGDGKQAFSGNGGPATAASIGYAASISVDGSGNLYLADYQNNRIRKVDAKTGIITTLVGAADGNGDGGLATNANINAADMYIDDVGNIYFAEQANNRVRKVDANTGIITTIAGTGQAGLSGDGGPATSANLNGPRTVYADGAGNVYISDVGNGRVRKVDISGIITTFSGGGTLTQSLADGGPASQASGAGIGVIGDRAGNIYFPAGGNRVRKVDPSGIISTVAGGGFFGEGGPASAAWLVPRDICVDGAGNLYMADTGNNRIRKEDANGVITTVAGSGTPGFSGDGGPATSANMTPNSVFTDASGNLYIGGNARVRKVDAKTGIISTVAGTGTATFSGDDGPATGAGTSVSDFFVDGAGNIYIADSGNNRMRKVDAKTGLISTVAGTGTAGYSGDGGSATAANLSNPTWVFVDGSGNLYITDLNNNRVRKVDAKTGIITTVAGDGTVGFSGDGGPATAAKFSGAAGLFVDNAGNLYVTDQNNNRIRKVSASGIITTVVGNGPVGFQGDGGAPFDASLFSPTAVFLDGAGNLYIGDSAGNFRVRKAGSPAVRGVAVAFSRSVSGRAADYRWKGAADASGQVSVEIVADPPSVGPANASGYYTARATDITGAIVGAWSSIPINGGQQINLSLPIGGLASVTGSSPLTSGALGLYANYPNPFNPATQIAYELPEAGEVRLVIYNTLGQEVRALVQGKQEAGVYRVAWDGKDAVGRQVSSGLYFYRLTSGGFAETRKMMLLK